MYLTMSRGGRIDEYTIPYADLSGDTDSISKDVEFILNEVCPDINSAVQAETYRPDFVLRATSWPEMVKELEAKGFEVDSAYRRNPDKHVLAKFNDETWVIEVTQYFKGDYEVRSDNMRRDTYFQECQRVRASAQFADGTEYDPEDYANGYTEWTELRSKQVEDSDGFMTDYTLWYNEFTEQYVCTFGDKDIYYPENTEPDAEFDSEEEAMEWFDSYNGFADDDAY